MAGKHGIPREADRKISWDRAVFQKAKATNSPTKAKSALTNGTTVHNIRGNSNAFGIWNLHSQIQTRFMLAWKMQRCSKQPMVARYGRNYPVCAKPKVNSGSRAPAA